MSRKRALPNVVADALERIWEGATADDLESAVLDFKEDPAHTPTRNATAKVVDMLVKTATCFANGSAGRAFIVFGIADRTPGPDAFNGTDRDPADIAGITNGIHIDLFHPFCIEGTVLSGIAQGLTESLQLVLRKCLPRKLIQGKAEPRSDPFIGRCSHILLQKWLYIVLMKRGQILCAERHDPAPAVDVQTAAPEPLRIQIHRILKRH